jgi:hypothetical protein
MFHLQLDTLIIPTGQLFAQCPYDASGSSVEQVTDSSRYFVLKIQDVASGRHAFVGLGFTDRNEAFDFNVALQDHQKYAMCLFDWIAI